MRNTLPDRVRIGIFEVDLRAGELRSGDNTIWLQEQPLFVLRMLVEFAGEVVTREEIKQKLWPNDTVVDFDHGINATIRRLRQALGDSADEPKYLETIARRGYRLVAPVERISAEALEAFSDNRANGNRDGCEPAAAATYLIGKKVSHYRVLEVLGGGGMGMLYKAEDLKLGRQVALKFLSEELAWDTVALQRFEREARTASSLDHPSICTIYEVEEHEQQPFIVMQLLRGETLRDRLATLAAEQKKLPLHELLEIAIQICEGLQAAHEKGIIHRDIKPANIFLTTTGQVKILDFGLAKPVSTTRQSESDGLRLDAGATIASPQHVGPVSPDATLTRLGVAMGTAGYMSPEQVRGEKLDARTDIFSFGLVLYEMGTGQRAFAGETAALVHDAIVHAVPTSARQLNPAIAIELEAIINKALQKDRDQRYQSAAEISADVKRLADRPQPAETGNSRVRSRWKWLAAIAVVLVGMIGAGLYWRSLRVPKLSEKDTLVLADPENTTGDAVFDDTLKQALSIQLEQSPFLNLIPDRKLNQTLREMGRPAGERLTPALAREVCQRRGGKAMLTSSITSLGSEYLIRLTAVDCDAGHSLAEVEERASGKEAVLNALDKGAIGLRAELGESLSSVQKYATPLAEATTPSLEALQAYSLAYKTRVAKGNIAALPFYRRAVELDPNFAMAYLAMSSAYGITDERSAKDVRRAYELRERVSERERLQIEAGYYLRATGELEKAAQVYEQWQKIYPREFVPYVNLGFVYTQLGNLDKVLQQAREAFSLEMNNWVTYVNLASAYQYLNRLGEAEAVYKEAQDRKVGIDNVLGDRYRLAFLKDDPVQMSQLVAASAAKPGLEDVMLAQQADTEGWYGKSKNARELTRRAMLSAQNSEHLGRAAAAAYEAAGAVREVEFGNPKQARAEADEAMTSDPSRYVRAMAAIALARAGDTPGAERIARELDKEFPLDTLVQKYWLPTIAAAVALQRKDPNRAVGLLQSSSQIELSLPTTDLNVSLCPVYLRGHAYLMLHDGKAAAAEFQKFIIHYGVVANFPWGAVARLGLARAYALQAQTDPAYREKARTAYQNFLTIWKDADPDIPIYKQAKLEYAKLE